MAIYARRPKSNFVPAPKGMQHAVCVDVVDLGEVDGKWGKKPKVRIVWQLAARMSDGKPYLAQKMYTNSLHEKATLRKDLESWRGRRFSDDELNQFDLEKLITVNCQLQVIHDTSDDGTVWANVQAVLPVSTDVPPIQAEGYTRVIDRTDDGGGDGGHARYDDDPVPF